MIKRRFLMYAVLILAVALAFMWKNNSSDDIRADMMCKIEIRCDDILENMDKLSEEKRELVPDDGIIYTGEVSFKEGESLFDAVLSLLKEEKIHIEFEGTSDFGSSYIEGINNLYSGDCGEMSGWIYMVNGESPQVGASEYILKNGDVAEWIYACNMMDYMEQ